MTKSLLYLLLIFISFSLPTIGQVYELNIKKETGIIGLGGGFLTGAYLFDKNQSPLTIENINELDDKKVFFLDRWALGQYSPRSATISDWFRNTSYFLPLTLITSNQFKTEWKVISVMYLETYLINESFTALVKSSFQRIRPYTYNPNVPTTLKIDKTTKRSFFSGHVSHVSSLSFLTATIFNDLNPNSKFKWIVYSAASALPLTTGYLRFKAGRHFPTDILFGFLSGVTIGILIPKLHKRQKNNFSISLIPTNNSVQFSAGIKF